MASRDGGKAFRKAGRGRPPKLDDDLIDRLCSHLRHGAYVETAAAACGISKVIFYRWLKIGNEKPKSIHGKLVNAVEQAMAESELDDLIAVTTARAKNWQAAAWRLQRRHPSRWAATHRPAVAPDTDPTEGDFRLAYSLDDDDREEKAK